MKQDELNPLLRICFECHKTCSSVEFHATDSTFDKTPRRLLRSKSPTVILLGYLIVSSLGNCCVFWYHGMVQSIAACSHLPSVCSPTSRHMPSLAFRSYHVLFPALLKLTTTSSVKGLGCSDLESERTAYLSAPRCRSCIYSSSMCMYLLVPDPHHFSLSRVIFYPFRPSCAAAYISAILNMISLSVTLFIS